MGKFSLDIFTSKLAIGTIWLVAIFMFVCGFYNIFPFIEELSNTATWGMVVAIPTLVFSYTLGALATYLSNALIFKSSDTFMELDDFISVATLENEFLTKRYESLKNQHDFFKACIPTIIFLGIAVIWSSYGVFKNGYMQEVKYVAFALGLITILAAFVIKRITTKQKSEIRAYVDRVQKTAISDT